jgi:hypothetical protein
MTSTPLDPRKPSSSTRSWLRVWSNSRSPAASALRKRPMASSSSMKMIEGASRLAASKSWRTRAAPSPTNFSTKLVADTK